MKTLSSAKEKRSFITGCFLHQSLTGPILEVGSGRDRFNRELFSKKFKVVSTNIYPQNVVNHICSVNCLPFKDEEFGCVICEHVLEHVEEPSRAIEEMKRVLKPSGLLILVVPFSWPIHEKPYDLWRFTEEGLRHLLMKRFDKVEFESIGNPHKPTLICTTARKPTNKRTAEETKRPKVSAIMSTYNRAHMIGRSIEGILNQTFKDWELIIVSDGSTDNTREVVLSYHDPRIRYFHKGNGGLSTGRNYGLQYAKGEYITYPDDDDIIFDHHFEMLVNYLDRHPEVGLVKSRAEIFFPNETLGHNIMGCGYEGYGALWAMMHRRSDLKKVGYFNSRLKVAQDTDFILNFYNFCTKKQIQTLACITAQYTIHGKNMVITREQRLNEEMDYIFTKRLKKALKRQEMKKDYFITLLFMYYEHYQRYKKVFLKLAEIFFIQYPSVGSAYSLSLAYYGIRKISKAIGFAHRATSIQIKKQNEKEFIYYRRLKGFAFALLGKLYAHKRKYGQAIKYFLSGLNFIPNNFMLKLELFHAYLDSGKEGLALEIYKKISNRISESYLKGVICLYKKDYLNAEKNFNKIRAIDKSIEYRLCSSLGKLYYHTNRKNKAEKYLARAWTLEKSTYFYVLYNRKIFSLQKNKRCFDKFLEKVNFGLPFMSIVKGLVGRRKRIH